MLTGRRWLLVGNECMGYLPDAGLNCEPVLFQEFSLMGQPRGDSRSLRAIFADFGIGHGARRSAAPGGSILRGRWWIILEAPSRSPRISWTS